MKAVELFFKKILLYAIGLTRSGRKISPRELPVNRFKRILIVKQHDQLGDLLITTPTIRALRNRFPNSYIAVVVREYTAPLMWDNPNVDEIIVFYEKLKKWNLEMFRLFLKQLRQDGGFDCAIVLNTVSRSLSSDIIALVSKAKYIIGPDHLQLVPDFPEKIYNVLTPRSPKDQLNIEHNLDIVRAFGVQDNGLEYDLNLDEDDIKEANKIHYALHLSGMTIGVHFGTLDVKKQFPLQKLAKVIDWIKNNTDFEVVLIVGPNEKKMGDELLRMVRTKVQYATLLPLRVAAAFIQRLDLFICNDTGTLHIASALKIPTVSFHSIYDPAIWKPPHARHIALRAEDTKITSITVEQVIDAVKIQIDKIKSAEY